MIKVLVIGLGILSFLLALPAQGQISGEHAVRTVKAEYDVLSDNFVWTVEVGKYVDGDFVSSEPKVLVTFEYNFVKKVATVNGQELQGFLSKEESNFLGDEVDKIESFCIKKAAVWDMGVKSSNPDFLPLPLIPIPEPKEQEKPKPSPTPTGKVLKAALQK